MEADEVGGRRSAVVEGAQRAIQQQELIPGLPAEGVYPSSITEVVNELAGFVEELDATCAPGVLFELAVRLAEMTARHPRRDFVSSQQERRPLR